MIVPKITGHISKQSINVKKEPYQGMSLSEHIKIVIVINENPNHINIVNSWWSKASLQFNEFLIFDV
jgi:hypothetical protein